VCVCVCVCVCVSATPHLVRTQGSKMCVEVIYTHIMSICHLRTHTCLYFYLSIYLSMHTHMQIYISIYLCLFRYTAHLVRTLGSEMFVVVVHMRLQQDDEGAQSLRARTHAHQSTPPQNVGEGSAPVGYRDDSLRVGVRDAARSLGTEEKRLSGLVSDA
jgi:hypothetical protein